MRRNFQKYLVLLTQVLLLSCALSAATADFRPAEKPNILLILTDDQAYGDAGFTGNPWIETPFLDNLAKQGTIFTNFYVNPRCAASRAALMTGRYPERSGVFHVTAGGHVMAESEETMAEMFQNAGYATAIVGKWHIGDHYPYWPNDQGFEHSLIHGGGAVGQLSDHPDNYWDMTAPLDERSRCYFDPTLYRNREPAKTEGYITDVFTDEAIRFVEQVHKDRPFFLYFSTNAPHDPFQAPEEYLEHYTDLPNEAAPNRDNGSPSKLSDYEQARYVYAMMTNLDDNLRRLSDRLKELGEWENTIVVFLSDNGPAGYRFNGGFRGKKGTVYEGGIRSPAFIHRPGAPSGNTVAIPAAHIDVLPTLAGLAGIEPTGAFPLDGRDLRPLLERGNAADWPVRSIFSRESAWMAPYQDNMVRRENWKLVSRLENGEPVFELYDLAIDPAEERDLAGAHPDRVADLRANMDRWYRDVRSSPNCRVHPITIGSPVENLVRLTRHEMVDSYSRGWFSPAYLGYFPLHVESDGAYSMKLTFSEPLPAPGHVEFIIGPAGSRINILDANITELTINDLHLSEGPATLQAWFQNDETVVSPFFIEIAKLKPSFHPEGSSIGLQAGEITDSTALLQVSLPVRFRENGSHFAYFEWAEDPGFVKTSRSDPRRLLEDSGYTVRQALENLKPGQRYFYRAHFESENAVPEWTTETGSFATHNPAESSPLRIAIGNCMSMGHFYQAELPRNKSNGLPVLNTLREARPDYVIFAGDNVYYDSPKNDRVVDAAGMRRKWRDLYSQPNMARLLSSTGVYWMKDDHDYRKNDSDPYGDYPPSHELGIALFREQAAVVDPGDSEAVTYRTHRFSKDTQIWFLEGRDFRSPNKMPDGPDKSLWGEEQRKWLEESLLQSDATWKLIATPTPMIGPDDDYKRDNHTNSKGFRHEGDSFKAWLVEKGLADTTFFLCGDRHWQYHSISPEGLEEFSCGTLTGAIARVGRLPGDPKSTDPKATIEQPFVQGAEEAVAPGFLEVSSFRKAGIPTLEFRFFDEYGQIRYAVNKQIP